MKLSRQPSFRRILLLRIILVGVPVLLVGLFIAFEQTAFTLRKTADKNLTESADRKAETIETAVHALQSNLVTAAETLTLRMGSLDEGQAFLEDLATQMPLNVSCLQLADWQTGEPLAGTCDIPLFGSQSEEQTELGVIDRQWPQDRSTLTADRFYIHSLDVQTQVAPHKLKRKRSQLNLVLSTPVYDEAGQLRHVLLAQGNLTQMEGGDPLSLLGYTVVIDESGTILAHPIPEEVGKNTSESMDSSQFQKILNSAFNGDQAVHELKNFTGSDAWLAGYSAANIPISPTEDEIWVVLAVAKVDTALDGFNEIKHIVLMFAGGLTLVHLLVMLYMARALARPIERLGEYASRIHDRRSSQAGPPDFRIRELNQLSSVLDNMVKRLEARAKELETAWQEAQAASKLKDELLANTSHELRTPLNAIIGCVRLVKDDLCDDSEEEKDLLDKADTAAIRLLKIINDILDIAKIESGKSSLALEDIDLEQTIREVVDLQSVEASQRGLWLRVMPFTKVVIHADPARLNQVILNLVSNAIKFTDTGGITIETTLQDNLDDFERVPSQELSSNGAESQIQWAVVSIIDTGIGIDPCHLPNLCQPFIMADSSKTRRYGGTGLGLAISRNLVELMHGWVSLHSEGVGKGTTVKVALPIVRIVLPVETPVMNSDVAIAPSHDISAEGVALTPANILGMNHYLKAAEPAEAPVSSPMNTFSS